MYQVQPLPWRIMLQQRYLLVDVEKDWSLQRVIEKESYKAKKGGNFGVWKIGTWWQKGCGEARRLRKRGLDEGHILWWGKKGENNRNGDGKKSKIWISATPKHEQVMKSMIMVMFTLIMSKHGCKKAHES